MNAKLIRYLGRKVGILGYDSQSGIIALNKPPGLLSHPNQTPGLQSLFSLPYDDKEEVYFSSEDNLKVWLLHRLDSATSGAILCCDNEKNALKVKELFANGQVHKKYIARVFGVLSKEDVWKDKLVHKRLPDGQSVGFVLQPDAIRERRYKTAVTTAAPVPNSSFVNENTPFSSLITLYPSTGLTHQLRIQCQSRGVPIVGDRQYGNFSLNRKFYDYCKNSHKLSHNRMYLHSLEIKFEYEISPGQSKTCVYQAPLPDDFNCT